MAFSGHAAKRQRTGTAYPIDWNDKPPIIEWTCLAESTAIRALVAVLASLSLAILHYPLSSFSFMVPQYLTIEMPTIVSVVCDGTYM